MSEQRAIATTNQGPPTDLAEVRANRPAPLPTAADLAHLLNLGEMLVKSGLLPQSLRTKEAAATVILKGHELGLPPMAAMEGIAVVQGKAVIGAHLLLALVKRAYGPGAIWVSETTSERCTISYRVPGVRDTLHYAFTIEDARTAGLTGKDTWQKYPAAMLRARAISAAVKLAFPEVVGGLYVAGELPGTQELVTDDGDVVIDHGTGEIVAAPEPRRVEPPPAPSPPTGARRVSNGSGGAPRFAGLHKAVAAAAKRDGGGMDGAAVHGCAHDLAAAKYGVDSLKRLSDDQLRALTESVGRMDAAALDAAWQWARQKLGAPERLVEAAWTGPGPGAETEAAQDAADGPVEVEYRDAAMDLDAEAAPGRRHWEE